MSIDTTFQPRTQTYAVDSSAVVTVKEAGQMGCTTFRIRAITAAGYLAYGPGNGPAPTAAGAVAPGLGVPRQVIGVSLGVNVYVELPPNTQFIGGGAFGTQSFEIQAGIGGTGG